MSVTQTEAQLPLVAHIVHRFDYGGMENGIVNIINTMDQSSFRHAVIALTEATAFSRRITNDCARVYSLGKRPGKDFAAYIRLWRLLRKLRPAVLHTRNIGTMDCVLVGRLAGVRVCIHGEHGWDIHDPDGKVRKYQLIRRFLNPLVNRFISVSIDIKEWLVNVVGIPSRKIVTICNGVDTRRYFPTRSFSRALLPQAFRGQGAVIVGAVMRFAEIKDPLNLVEAFIIAHRELTRSEVDLRLVVLGDGALKTKAAEMIESAGLSRSCWLPGMLDEVADAMRCFDVFVLSSRREGISNTILEALATGLPIVATRTGGNPEIVADGCVGALVSPENPRELAQAILKYATDPELRRRHGEAARRRAEEKFSLATMASNYRNVYSAALSDRRT